MKWVYQRCAEKVSGVETPIGTLPGQGELDFEGLDLSPEALETLTTVDVEGWLSEIPKIREFYAGFGENMPEDLEAELDALERRLRDA